MTYYTTTKNFYDFKDLETATYSYKVRVKTAEGYSPWSEEAIVDIVTGIQSVEATNGWNSAEGKTFLLDGRQAVGSSLRPGIYVRNGKKVVIK